MHKDWCISDEEWLEAIEKMKNHKRLLFDNKYITSDCGAGRIFLCIASNGDITACTRKYKKEFILGNIFKDSIIDVWNSSPILDRLRNKNKTNCMLCDF